MIKMLVLTDDFPRAPFENLFTFCFLLTSKQEEGNLTSFSHSYIISYLEFRSAFHEGV